MASRFNLFNIGRAKEQQAKRWIKQQGISITHENFRCKGGEIDLIGLQNLQLIFFEVKYRKSDNYGHPAEMVNIQKQQHIIHCAQQFLLKNPKYQNYAMRFDVITFTADQTEPDWIQDAFQT